MARRDDRSYDRRDRSYEGDDRSYDGRRDRSYQGDHSYDSRRDRSYQGDDDHDMDSRALAIASRRREAQKLVVRHLRAAGYTSIARSRFDELVDKVLTKLIEQPTSLEEVEEQNSTRCNGTPFFIHK